MECRALNNIPFGIRGSVEAAGLYCACVAANRTSPALSGFSICPNPDLAGVGVRAAFYAGSLTNGACLYQEV
jgi:hypothetical protein